jgi:ATP-dependent exoDNAse (exonuclease V) beta subunit
VGGRDHDGLEAGLRELAGRRTGWHWRGFNRKWFAEGVARDEVLERRDAAKAALDAMLEAADADLAACLREELRPVVHAYQAAKQRAGVLDFVDLLIRARDLIVADATVRCGYQARFTHFFVDEFQDTDPLQAEILLLLAADDPEECSWRNATPIPGKIFLVGDPKQSIYRFRRADVAIYEATKRHLEAQGAAVLYLTTSFRSVPSLQVAVNAAFAPCMRGAADGSQADYVALEPSREEVAPRPSIVALPVPRPYGDYGRVVAWRIEDSLPDAAGAFVDWLVNESGWTLVDRDGRSEPIRPRHVCLLFRRFKSFQQDVTRPYVRALEARHDREEVLAIRNALGAIEWPDDDLRVYATLRGPLFALSDEDLLAVRHVRGSLHPLRRPAGEPSSESERCVEEALAVLRSLHLARNRRSIADTISRLLEAVRAHAGIAIWPTGEQALANCLRTIDLARRFERRGAASFRAFVERMESEALRGDAEDAPVVEEGTEGVRIMTTHRAKGLEFPVVVLCDPTCRASRDQPTRHVDPARGLWAEPLCGCAPHDLLEHREEELRRDHAEGVRIAYVAATRARDLLVVPVVADDEWEGGWLEALHPVVYPESSARGEAAIAPGCPAFGPDAMAARPHNARKTRAPVAPGRLSPRAGSHQVVWWDPKLLRLDVAENVGLRQQRILEADRDGSVAASGERAHERWQEAREALLARGGVPFIATAPVTALAEDLEAQKDGAVAVSLHEVEEDRGERPGGRRFGVLVHAVLATVSLDADAEAVRSAAALQGRLVGAGVEEVDAAAQAVVAALRHPLLLRAARATALRRETPVMLKRPDGGLAEGVVDLAFREDSPDGPRWTVVDFKTDREIGDRHAVYEAQVGLYVDAVARATGEPAEGMLLVV